MPLSKSVLAWHTWEHWVRQICSRMGQNVAMPVWSSSVRSCDSEASSESYFPWAVALHKRGVCHQNLPDGARSFLHVQPVPCADTEGSRMTIMFASDPNSPHFSTCLWKEIISLRGWLVNLVPLVQLWGRAAQNAGMPYYFHVELCDHQMPRV